MQIITCKSEKIAKKKSAERLNHLLAKSFQKKTNTLLLLSGGSALSFLKSIKTKYLGEYLTISVLDERYSQDPKVNNFAQIKTTSFYKSAKRSNCTFFDTTLDNKTAFEMAKEFEAFLRTWLAKNPKGTILATLGLGEDGHTAGIMPFPNNEKDFEMLFLSERLAVFYDAEEKNKYPLRITTTLTFFEKINHAVCLVLGEKKKNALTDIISSKKDYNKIPGLVLQRIKDLQIFTDIDLQDT